MTTPTARCGRLRKQKDQRVRSTPSRTKACGCFWLPGTVGKSADAGLLPRCTLYDLPASTPSGPKGARQNRPPGPAGSKGRISLTVIFFGVLVGRKCTPKWGLLMAHLDVIREIRRKLASDGLPCLRAADDFATVAASVARSHLNPGRGPMTKNELLPQERFDAAVGPMSKSEPAHTRACCRTKNWRR